MEVISVNEAAELLIAALAAIAAGGLVNAPITTFVVSLVKRIPALATVSGGTIQFVVGLLLTAVFWLAQAAGLQVQFESITEVVATTGPMILGLLTTLAGSNALYQVANRSQVGVIGYSRPPYAHG